jgi:hypothetical protein
MLSLNAIQLPCLGLIVCAQLLFIGMETAANSPLACRIQLDFVYNDGFQLAAAFALLIFARGLAKQFPPRCSRLLSPLGLASLPGFDGAGGGYRLPQRSLSICSTAVGCFASHRPPRPCRLQVDDAANFLQHRTVRSGRKTQGRFYLLASEGTIGMACWTSRLKQSTTATVPTARSIAILHRTGSLFIPCCDFVSPSVSNLLPPANWARVVVVQTETPSVSPPLRLRK